MPVILHTTCYVKDMHVRYIFTYERSECLFITDLPV